jgi:hypothetical protein
MRQIRHWHPGFVDATLHMPRITVRINRKRGIDALGTGITDGLSYSIGRLCMISAFAFNDYPRLATT